MGGAVIKLNLRGQQDEHLTANHDINFLVRKYHHYVDFSIEQLKVYFFEDVNFGKKITIDMPRRADFMNKINFCFSLPPLNKIDGTYAAWTNTIGHAIIDYVELEIGGYRIDKQYGLFLEIWEELSGVDKNENQAIGKMANMESVKFNAVNETKYCVPLQFWFCKNIQSSLPIMSLAYHPVKVIIKLKPFNECVIYDGNTEPLPVKISESYLLTDYIYIDETERIKLRSKPFDILIEQVQYKDVQGSDVSVGVFKTDVPFNHPVKELLWVFIEDESINNNDWFNFSKRNPTPFTKTYGIMKNCTLWVDGKEYEERKDEIVYRLINSKRYHKNVTEKHIYITSFCDKPEEWQPSGSLNFSRIDEVILYGDILSDTPPNKMFIFGVNYNWLSIKNGISSLRYIT